MRVGLLGGGGVFALNAACHFESKGMEVFGIGRSGPKAPPFWLAPKDYRFWELHLVDQFDETLKILDAMRPDVIVNFAAQGEGAASFGDNGPDFFKTNTWGSARIANAMRKVDWLDRFVHIGTSELYGSVDRPAKESDPLKSSSPYAISKAAFDEYLINIHQHHGFPMNIVRPSNCYCPGQQLYRVIPKTIICALSGKKLPLQGGGKAQKSYLHATDLSKALVAVIEKGKPGKVYNCGPAGPITIKALVSHVAEACGVMWDELVEEVPDRVGQDGRYWLDCAELARDTYWTPTIGLARGLAGMVEWVKQFPELLTMDTSYVHRA